jgi:hypothetical protein
MDQGAARAFLPDSGPWQLCAEAEMARLFMILYSMIGTTLAGSFMVAALASGMDTLKPIVLAAGLGALLAVPVAWLVARRLAGEG